jgi:hypothetical protein
MKNRNKQIANEQLVGFLVAFLVPYDGWSVHLKGWTFQNIYIVQFQKYHNKCGRSYTPLDMNVI